MTRKVTLTTVRRGPSWTPQKSTAPRTSSLDTGTGGGTGSPGNPPSPFRGEEGGSVIPTSEPTKNEEKTNQVTSLMDQLQSLDKATRKQVLDQLALQVHNEHSRGGDNRDLDMWAAAIQTALQSAIGGGGGADCGLLMIKRFCAPRANWGPVEEFMTSSNLISLKVNERNAVYRMLARLLVEHCQRVCQFTGAPLTAKFVAAKCSELPGVFDKAFPGYLRMGIALVVARQLGARSVG